MGRVVRLIVLFAFSLSHVTADEPAVRQAFQWQPHSDPSTCQEENSWWTTPQGIRIFLNRPRRDAPGTEPAESDQKATSKTHLLIFATPNGNSLEETSGSAPLPELSFRFGIQHILAQTRLLRTLDPDRAFVLAIVQAPKLSWPAFRGSDPEAGAVIPKLVQTLSEAVNADEITLSGHSGGGAFLLEYIARTSLIPTAVRRFLFLDATYSWDDTLHRAKVDEWLRKDAKLRLVSIAYDDREITLNGRRVVGPDGGTWRATERMRNGFAQTRMLMDDVIGPFLRTQDEGRQIVLLRHPNPENKILHTALVGDLNGLIAGMTFGTAQESSWGNLGDGPAYRPYIPSSPLRAPSQWNAELVADTPKLELPLPPRLESMRGGRELAGELERLFGKDREDCIASELLSGNMPHASRELVLIRYRATDTAGTDHVVEVRVGRDVLSLGSDSDSFRIPMQPQTATRIAGETHCTLMTTLLSDIVFDAADARLTPAPMTQDRQLPSTFLTHHELIEQALKKHDHATLIAGHKKDVVQTSQLKDLQHVAIYGWHLPHGEPIQPLYTRHFATYVDYSHGVRLVDSTVTIDGEPIGFEDVLKSEHLRLLLTRD